MSQVEKDSAICQACGACCAHSAEWPRFTLEDDAALALIPERFVTLSGMRSQADRCSALTGEVGRHVACAVYDVRPIVCRECVIGDDACTIARAGRGLPPLERR